MSTFLVVSGVVTAALVVVLSIAITDVDQPATIRRRSRRASKAEKPRPAKVRPAPPAPTARPAPPAPPAPAAPPEPEWQGPSGPPEPEWQEPALPEPVPEPEPEPVPVAVGYQPSGAQRRRDRRPIAQPDSAVKPPRVRSGVALIVMIAVMGTLVALAVGAAVAFTALALREAVG